MCVCVHVHYCVRACAHTLLCGCSEPLPPPLFSQSSASLCQLLDNTHAVLHIRVYMCVFAF